MQVKKLEAAYLEDHFASLAFQQASRCVVVAVALSALASRVCTLRPPPPPCIFASLTALFGTLALARALVLASVLLCYC